MRDRYAIGEGYGGTRHLSGGPVREWEWVHVGRDFALTHPLGHVGGAMWFVLVFALAHAGLAAYQALFVSPWTWLFFVFDLLVVAALLKRWRVAWPLVWVQLLSSIPLSLPLIVYWADGTRPNLIYRHRFERLVPEMEPENV